MNWVLFAQEFVPVSKTYHHTIDGQIVTALIIAAMVLVTLYSAYRNFVIGKPTSDAI